MFTHGEPGPRRAAHPVHESPATTHQYLEADLAVKLATLSQLPEPAPAVVPFKPDDDLLAFLEGL